MIIPNLMVTDMARSVAFYRDGLGMELTMSVTQDRQFSAETFLDGSVFVTLRWNAADLMLQTRESLAGELPLFTADATPPPAGTIYFRGLDPDPVLARLSADALIKGPEMAWYGMLEAYVRDPDGHVLCLGIARGGGPDAA